jgi:hypothetical protein
MKTIGIYPGNFQPATRGHYNVYKQLRQLIGPDVFIIATDRTPTPDAPLNFGEKESIWVRHGVPPSHIIKVNDWRKPKEVFSRFSAKHTNAIFGLTIKEVEELNKRKKLPSYDSSIPVPPKTEMGEKMEADAEETEESDTEVWLDLEGKPSFFQPYKGNEHKMLTIDQHAYVMVVEDDKIDGKPISTANIREGLASPKYVDTQKKKFFQWVFGWFDIGLFQLLSGKFKAALKTTTGVEQPAPSPTGISIPSEPVPSSVNECLDELIKEFLDEFMSPMSTPQGEDNMTDDGLPDPPGAAERRSQVIKTRQDAVKMKSAAERDLKSLQADTKWKEADLKAKKADEIPNKRKEIGDLNKKISTIK